MNQMIIDKAIAGALFVVTIATLTACGGNGGAGGAPGDIEGFILEDANTLLIMNVRQILEADEAPFIGAASRFGLSSDSDDIEDIKDDWRDEWEDDAILSLGTALDDVDRSMLVVGSEFSTYIVKGTFDFADIRSTLEDEDFDDSEYRESEIWESHDGVAAALFDSSGIYVLGEADSVKEVIKAIHRGEGFAHPDEHALVSVRNKAGDGLFSYGDTGCSDDFEGISARALENCEAIGITIVGGNEDEMKFSGAVLFSSERRAESGMDDFEDSIEDDESIDADIEELKVDGEFVTFKVTIYE